MQQDAASTSTPIRSRISIRFADVEGALTRTLMTLARRGWSVVDMHASRKDGRLEVDAELEATPKANPMPAGVLQRQLARLHDVQEVLLAPSRQSVRKDLFPC